MSSSKKFNAFSGVFTPSILTILGVIMYMRLGWVVGQAGLIAALVIIVISHVISISTGLSISSISTDKKVKAGGIYYILSRSLGLPMGGAIGIALFVGTALSISLYIVGFTESFLSIDEIREFLGLGTTIDDFRIVGTAIIIILVILAFISTSLAIKTQFIIFGAIILSIVSIVLGFFIGTDNIPETAAKLPFTGDGSESLEYVFSIFFPAVTGFTAGVAMSGDLKDPQKDIPKGTLWAIGVGFVVYVSLAVVFAFFVDREVLLFDTNFITNAAWNSPMVFAGIWGATLSSALGGILGGPRIMQAMALDKIGPKLFAKGYGKDNEPRNALLLTFAIAEMGILIGELNVIAGIVSMFYLASYGFINLSYAFESWASPDFRPKFKIPIYVGILGFFASFAVMFKLDMISMFAALIIMGLLFFLLTRKQLRLEHGDVWQSVWVSVIRTALDRMDKKGIEERNWEPNIILFSGGTKRRPHLISFGKALVGKYGLLSNFDLIETGDGKITIPKHKQSMVGENETGVFTRRQSVSSVYEGIESIAQIYGFSGIEPNTVLMGWAGQSKNPKRFVKMLNTLDRLDLNVLLLDYDKRYGFGNKKLIDIWWRGAGYNGNLALTLSRFIWSSEEWSAAKVRLMIINYNTDEAPSIYRKAQDIFNHLRIDAEIKIINNQIERKSFYDIIRIESVNTDLIFLGIPPKIDPNKAEKFVQNTSDLMHDIGSVVLVKASTQFKNQKDGADFELTNKLITTDNEISIVDKSEIKLPTLKRSENSILASNIDKLKQNLNSIANTIYENYQIKIYGYYKQFTNELLNATTTNFKTIKNRTKKLSQTDKKTYIQNNHSNYLIKIRKIINKYKENSIEIQNNILASSISYFITNLSKNIQYLPEYIPAIYTKKDLEISENDDKSLVRYKKSEQLKLKLKKSEENYRYLIQFKKVVATHLPTEAYKTFYKIMGKWGLVNLQFIINVQNTIKQVRNSFFNFENSLEENLIFKEIEETITNSNEEFSAIKLRFEESQKDLYLLLIQNFANIINRINNDGKKLNINREFRKKISSPKLNEKLEHKIKEIPALWERNQKLLFNAAEIELSLFLFENRLRRIFKDAVSAIQSTVDETLLNELLKVKKYLAEYKHDLEKGFSPEFSINLENSESGIQSIYTYFKEISNATFKKIRLTISKFPETIEVISEDSMNNFAKLQFERIESIPVAASRLLDYIVQSELIEPIEKITNELPDKLLSLNVQMKDMVRLTEFSLSKNQVKDSKKAASDESRLEFIDEQSRKVEHHITIAKKYKEHVLLRIDERLNATFENLSYFVFVNKAGNLKQYIRGNEIINRFSSLLNKYENAKKYINHQFDELWYRPSKAILAAKSISEEENKNNSTVNKLLNTVENLSIKPEILDKLPFYYKQLFLRKQTYYNEFWFGREPELKEAEKTIKRYKNGYNGSILITGEQSSGKTFLAHYMSNRFMPQSEVFYLQPPLQGSISVNLFKIYLQRTLNNFGTFDEIFNSVPENSILIIDDFELWWEKSTSGFAVVNEILQIIENFSHKVLFIINMNIHTYKFVNKIKNIDSLFLNIIRCMPFNAEQLKELILFRHKSSGLKLHWKNRHEDDIRSVEFASYFAKLFTLSTGNVGLALTQWIANITDFQENEIYIKTPRIIDTEGLDRLDTKSYTLCVLFVLHKNLTVAQLKRITLQKPEAIKRRVNYLLRSGILISHDMIYEINPVIYISLRDKLIELGML